jgi:4-amino-4-deoxy-L-arabinose transferase-like glycosyltransferase
VSGTAGERQTRRNGQVHAADPTLGPKPAAPPMGVADDEPPESLPSDQRPLLALAAIMVVYLGLALGYAVATPRWNNPDEPAHFNYLAQLATSGRLPVLQPGDWDSAQLSQRLQSGRFTTGEPIDSFRYEGHQPPLYYALMAPVYRLTAGRSGFQVVALRCGSIVLGLVLLGLVYATTRTLAPDRPELPPLAAGTVAFIPMHTAMTAAINNDTLAEVLASASILVSVLGLRRGFTTRLVVLLGVLGGLVLLTKVTIYLFFPLALVAIALEASRQAGPAAQSRATRQIALAVAIAGLISGWWFVRDVAVYGWPDLFGLIRHDRVVVGQPRPAPLDWTLEPLRYFLYNTFRSFWAQFGWSAVVVDPVQQRPYWLYLLLVGLASGGLVRFWRRELPGWPLGAASGLFLILAALVLVAAEVAVYNLSFIQAQGRYLFPAILPIGLLLGLGWSTLAEISPDASRWRWVGFGLGFYLVWALTVEALSWLLTNAQAPFILHLVPIGPVWLARRVQVRRSRLGLTSGAAVALVGALALIDLAALMRFVQPYFQGF